MIAFADDILRNRSVHSQDDHTELQHGVNTLVVWSLLVSRIANLFYKQNNKKKSFNSLQLNYCNTTAAIGEHVEVASKFVTC